MSSITPPSALVSVSWLAEHRHDDGLAVISVASRLDERSEAPAIPGTVLTHWRDFYWDDRVRDFADAATLQARLAALGIGPDRHVVLAGEPTQFGFYAWWALRYAGLEHVSVLDGGLKAWRAEGLETQPTVVSPPDAGINVDRAPWDARRRIGREELLQRLEDETLDIVDGRSLDEYEGRATVPGAAPGLPLQGPERAGHIPGARLLVFADLLDEAGRLKPVSVLREKVQAAGLSAERETAVYCRTGHRSSLIFFVLSQLLGFRHARLYDGSWTEWGVLVNAPIAR